jgi:hypothetical protein
LQLQEEGRVVTPRDYFESALKPQPEVNDEVVQKNKIRALLATFFPNRDCLTMVRPLNDENLLRNLLKQPYETLRPEFREQMTALKRKISTSLKPKRMMSSVLNGGMLVTLAESYVEAFNSGASPVISSVWDRVVESQCDEALDAAKKAFKTHFETQAAELSRESDGETFRCLSECRLLMLLSVFHRGCARKWWDVHATAERRGGISRVRGRTSGG